MAILDEAELDRVLKAHNPWWTSGALPQRHTLPRRQEVFLKKTRRPVLVTGPRRSGKTTALLRLMEDPRAVAYLALDHPLLRLVPLHHLVDRALGHLATDGRPLLLLDGLQGVPDWPRRFTEIVKTRPHPRVVAAAAVAPGIEDAAFDQVVLPPLGFREFCALRGVPDLEAPPLDLVDPHVPDTPDPAEDHLFDRVLDPVLADYLVRGGFPEAALAPDLDAAQEAVREGVVARAVYRDLPAVVGVARLADLERVLLATLLESTAPLHVEAFADALELDRHTVGRYLDHLGRAFLLTSLKNYAASTERSRQRLFPTDPSLPNALLARGIGVLARSKARRSLLVGAVVRQVEQFAQSRGFDVAYYRDGDLDADVVLVTPEGVVPVVIVDREEIDEDDRARLQRLMKRLQAPTAFLLSRARPRRKAPVSFFESVYHLPAAYFLYSLCD